MIYFTKVCSAKKSRKVTGTSIARTNPANLRKIPSTQISVKVATTQKERTLKTKMMKWKAKLVLTDRKGGIRKK